MITIWEQQEMMSEKKTTNMGEKIYADKRKLTYKINQQLLPIN